MSEKGKWKWKWGRDKGSERQRKGIGEDDIVATAETQISGERKVPEMKGGFDWSNTEILGKIWWIETCSIGKIGDSKVEFQGGGICVSEKGVIITASHLFDELEDEEGSRLPDGQVTRGRCYSDDGLRELECIKQYKTLGIAFARIKSRRSGDKFEYIDLPDSATVQSLDEVVAVVHSSAPYSRMSATVCFPYTSPPSLQIPAKNLSIATQKNRNINLYKSGHENPFTITTAGLLVDPLAVDHPFYENLMQLRYDLPLIEVHQIQGTFGMEGCPLFTPIGEFVGLIIGGSDCSEFVLPVDIINAVARPVIHEHDN